ncbi:tRNA pseudouridine synthase A [Andreesenia angusta]|uniref:tRNA pseudouridine synthase A n=1 Tax=Andreesenia angusta TaxID=39480 RepID=A0A1S1V7H3_9FIRM|nr:tRNA pseudouridine(38-40) synthase TruA [Andreesenia angusta]OHW62454.1 tRNA pseudouridine synthase A [Andreesenia angusta]
MRNIKLTIEYDGSRFNGWQKQSDQRTVEGELEKAIKRTTGEEVKLIASGRTDTGVHAYGQVANFLTGCTIPGEKFLYAVNDRLPDDVSVKASEEVARSFHSRFSAHRKTYRYVFLNEDVRSPIYRNYAYQVKHELDFKSMKKAIKHFVGRQDYSSFVANRSNKQKNIRTVYSTRIRKDGNFIEFEIEGNGFLHNMVRIIAGTLVEVGHGKRSPDSIPGLIECKDRHLSGHTAPAEGLYLLKVFY